ncbi:MAG TPA: ATP-binding protein [Gemmatimonadales bacterium]|nr:ATP-binding protein [Gemmatimonadales bacterium]
MGNLRYPRALEAPLERDLDLAPVVVLVGARQVGKSTLGREIAHRRGMAYRTLDDPDVLRQAETDPAGLLADLGGNGFIDEVQRAPGLFLAVKAVVDRVDRPGQYLLSGSAQPRIRDGVGDSLVGRAIYRTLRPLTQSELRLEVSHPGWSFLFEPDERTVLEELEGRAAASGSLAWQDTVQTGGFPRVVAARPDHRTRLLDEYVRVFATRDIREILDVGAPDQFESFLRLLASRTGTPRNLHGMGTDLQLPPTTLRRWLHALESSFLVERIAPYSRNAGSRVIKAPKLYMVDSALALAASQEATPTGFHLENLVAVDLRVWEELEPGRTIHHWRLASGQEVDFVVEQHGALLPVEVKGADQVTHRDGRHLRTFLERYAGASRALLLSSDPEIRPMGQGVIAAPWWAVV